MNRFFHECINDPALGGVLAFALVVAVVLGWLVVKDKLKRRRQRQGQRRREQREKRQRANPAGAGPN